MHVSLTLIFATTSSALAMAVREPRLVGRDAAIPGTSLTITLALYPSSTQTAAAFTWAYGDAPAAYNAATDAFPLVTSIMDPGFKSWLHAEEDHDYNKALVNCDETAITSLNLEDQARSTTTPAPTGTSGGAESSGALTSSVNTTDFGAMSTSTPAAPGSS
ncbi:hypothetical protein B0H17DRAFT_1194581 [Mycena rosella]|uniref:Uncharacterized protein n=1 Tax=Mycena rosella TaxID=1033263 RepID=A0AAD7E143_MYCRO|nr:hypothetical protein B0H17DRAFT_1194581 [Mycena rosella]